MDFLIANSYATSTVYVLTDQALDLINFFSQLLTVGFGVVLGFMAVMILLIIFKP